MATEAMIELPRFRKHARCRKCAFDAIGTQYQPQGGHSGCPTPDFDSSRRGPTMTTYTYMTEEQRAKVVEDWQAFREQAREHLDRTCGRCGYSWSEATVEED